MNEISARVSRGDAAIFLTTGRTIMASERTLLAFLRTSLAFCIAGIGLIKYLDHPLLVALGWIFVMFAGLFLIWGIHRYRHIKKGLKKVTPIDQLFTEKEIGL
jgi:uncharacterized membrane protein YidH (DUF202 family)